MSKRKLLEQMRDVLRRRHYSIRTERSYCSWVRNEYPYDTGLVGSQGYLPTMIYTHVLHQGEQGVPSPLDELEL